jgi:hypothetical protein
MFYVSLAFVIHGVSFSLFFIWLACYAIQAEYKENHDTLAETFEVSQYLHFLAFLVGLIIIGLKFEEKTNYILSLIIL